MRAEQADRYPLRTAERLSFDNQLPAVVEDDAEAVGEPAPDDRLAAQNGDSDWKSTERTYLHRAEVRRCLHGRTIGQDPQR